MAGKYHPEIRYSLQAKQIQELLEQATEDRRLSDAQRYLGLVDIFGCDPLLLAAQRLKRAMDHRSKITLPEDVILKFLVMFHDRCIPMPDQKARKRGAGEDQFELNFEWQSETQFPSQMPDREKQAARPGE